MMVAMKLGAHVGGNSFDCSMRRSVIQQQTCVVCGTTLTLWAPNPVKFALAIVPGVDNVLIIGSKAIGDRVGVDVMSSPKDYMARDSQEVRMTPEDVAKVEICI